MKTIQTPQEIETLVSALSETEAREKLNDIIKEQFRGEWIAAEGLDKASLEAHEDWVRSRTNLGISLTAFLRGIQAAPAKARKATKASITPAFSEDLLA